MQRANRRPRKRVAVLLAGSGVHDGSEIHEAVLTLLALDRAGAEAVCVAPNVAQTVVFNHLTGDAMPGESRNVWVESARIARGDARDLASLKVDEVDGLIAPGGYGVTRNLSTYALTGRDMMVLPDVGRVLRELYAKRKPMGFACTAPLLAARVLGSRHPELGIGGDYTLKMDMEAWGARVRSLTARDLVVDRDHRVACVAAYTATTAIGEVADGIERLARAVLEMT